MSTTIEAKPKRSRRPNGYFSKEVQIHQMDAIIEAYQAGVTVTGLVKEFRVTPKGISQFLTERGVIRLPGQSGKSRKGMKSRPRLTNIITDDITNTAMNMMASMTLVSIAKELNVNPAELSVALKARGASLNRGPRKKTTVLV